MADIYAPRYRRFLHLLRQARKDAGLSQVEAAVLLGESQAFVSKSERGERRVDFIELLDFAAVYQKPLNYFVPSNTD
jgi:transcriptional regulator with XRE-family HTH domain